MSARRTPHALLPMAGLIAASTACLLTALAEEPAIPESDREALLRDQYSALSERLEQSSIQRGLYVDSAESGRSARGDIYAVVDYPFATVSDTFSRSENWCEALILHLNIKYCRAALRDDRTVLSVAIGKKFEQPLSETHRIEFGYNVTASRPDYMEVELDARKGPLGTRNYQIALQLVALDSERSFLHVRYSYAYGILARLAMRAYFATSGHDKVGFTMIEAEGNRPRHLIGGVRGALERNTMRYYLAIDAYMGTLASPASERFEESLERWFDATQRHALQLYEVDRDAYLAMKRHEYLRQQSLR